MSQALTIARNDFGHTLQDRLIWGALVLLGVMFLPSVGSVSSGAESALWEHVISMMADLIPFSFIVFGAVGYNSITGERAEGSIRLVLGLSGTRRDVILGKFISRLSIVVLTLGLVLVIACIQTVQIFGIQSLVPFWVMGAWMLLYGVVWTAITIGYSAAFSSQYRTLGALVATYALFTPSLSLWEALVNPLVAFIFTGSFTVPYFKTLAEAPSWIHLMLRLNPLQGFAGMVQWSVAMVTGKTPVISFGFNLIGITVFIAVGVLVLRTGIQKFEDADLDDEESGPNWSSRFLPKYHTTTMDSTIKTPLISVDGHSRVATIVRGDINRALKSWVVQGTLMLFFLIIIPEIWQTLDFNPKRTYGRSLPHTLAYTFLLPTLLLGTAVGYRSVVGERESDTIRYALGLPSTRRDLLLGKLVARVAITVAAIFPVLLFTAAVVGLRLGRLPLIPFLVSAVWLLLLGVVWTTFVVGISAAVSSHYRVLAVILGSYLLFSIDNGLWGSIVRPSINLVFTGQFTTPTSVYYSDEIGPVWFRYLDAVNPLVALQNVREGLWIATGQIPSSTILPVVLFSLAIILLFAVGTLYVGYRRFDQTDLG